LRGVRFVSLGLSKAAVPDRPTIQAPALWSTCQNLQRPVLIFILPGAPPFDGLAVNRYVKAKPDYWSEFHARRLDFAQRTCEWVYRKPGIDQPLGHLAPLRQVPGLELSCRVMVEVGAEDSAAVRLRHSNLFGPRKYVTE
jgi:hypothetical protein